MANYKIVGADQKEYGPVSADQIRHWVGENRLNAQTRAREEGSNQWQSLGDFAEFSDLFAAAEAANPSPPPFSTADFQEAGRQAAMNTVKAPAISLVVTGALNLVWGTWQIINAAAMTQAELSKYFSQMNDPQAQRIFQIASGPIRYVFMGLTIAISAVIVLGALKMMRLKSYPLAVTAGILAVLPCMTPCCGLISFPFGIWALIMLNKPEVKLHFS